MLLMPLSTGCIRVAYFFESEYKKQTEHLFNSPQYEFVTESHPAGYDPEAMVVSTTDAVYVVFRGTDRVATKAQSVGVHHIPFNRRTYDLEIIGCTEGFIEGINRCFLILYSHREIQ